MAYISVPEGVPGIVGLVMSRPEMGKPLYDLAQTLLRKESPLTPAERELIATHVSSRNNCMFCMSSHAAAARELFGENSEVVDCVLDDPNTDKISEKMKALLNIAGKVQQSGKSVTPSDIDEARKHGADDKAIHDTVLIAAAFCMYNRYVDGLDSLTPTEPEAYIEMGKRLSTVGYNPPNN